MTRYLIATDSVDVSAAACDYLDGRVESSDAVIAVAVTNDDLGTRDASDALNVVRVRLALPAVETSEHEGDPASEVVAIARDRDVDVLLAGSPSPGPGDVVPDLLAGVDRPLIVVPVA